MNRALISLAVLTSLASAPALADGIKTPKALGRAEGIYTPRAGDWEFSLTAPAFPIGAQSAQGVGVKINTCNGCSADTTLGLSAGLGYAVTDLVEVGAALGFLYTNSGATGAFGQSSSATYLTLEPFVKLNFGSGMARDSRINPFVLGALQLGYANAGTSTALFSLELAGGAEFMITHTWGISVFIPLTFTIPTASGSSAIIGLGLGYGLVAYFD